MSNSLREFPKTNRRNIGRPGRMPHGRRWGARGRPSGCLGEAMPKRKRLGEQNAELGVLENHDYFMVSLPNNWVIHQPGLINMII